MELMKFVAKEGDEDQRRLGWKPSNITQDKWPYIMVMNGDGQDLRD